MSKVKTIEEVTASVTTDVTAEFSSLLAATGDKVDTQATREFANRLDGVRYALNVLRDEHLLEAKTPDEWRDALRVLRLLEQTAACSHTSGFSDGINRLRFRVARLLETTPAA
jgi:hypothetical protein